MPNLKFATTFALSAAVCLGAIMPAHALAPHRAVYEVKLKDASDRSGIAGMDGRIVYEFRGTACDGYTTNFRFVTRLSAHGETNVTDQRTTTFEDGEGKNFRFITKTYVNDKKDKEIEGTADFENGGTFVALKKPEEVNLKLDQAKFPAAHSIDLLERAQAGERFYQEQIFDGSDGGDRVLTTAVVIGPEKSGDTNETLDALEGESFRNVSVSYYDTEDQSDGQAEYSIAFKLYDNGITGDLVMDYGDFALTGKMSDLEVFEAESCD